MKWIPLGIAYHSLKWARRKTSPVVVFIFTTKRWLGDLQAWRHHVITPGESVLASKQAFLGCSVFIHHWLMHWRSRLIMTTSHGFAQHFYKPWRQMVSKITFGIGWGFRKWMIKSFNTRKLTCLKRLRSDQKASSKSSRHFCDLLTNSVFFFQNRSTLDHKIFAQRLSIELWSNGCAIRIPRVNRIPTMNGGNTPRCYSLSCRVTKAKWLPDPLMIESKEKPPKSNRSHSKMVIAQSVDEVVSGKL